MLRNLFITAAALASLPSPSAAAELFPDKTDPNEAAVVKELAAIFAKSMAKTRTQGTWHRGFHAKAHGCVRGTLTLDPKRPAETRVGTFAADKTYDVWARFSNGSSEVQRDLVPDARGVALKILGVPGAKLLPGAEADTTHDLLFCASPTLFVSTVAELRESMRAISKGGVTSLKYLFKNPRYGARVAKFMTATPLAKNPLHLPYYSASPFALGPRAAKYALLPCKKRRFNVAANLKKNAMRAEMQRSLDREAACFDLVVQLYKDARTTPIEDFAIEWKTKHAPFVKVARLRIEKQKFDTPERNAFCEHLTMNPWRATAEHRPIGALNRVRRMLYDEVSRYRHQKNNVPLAEPTAGAAR